MDSLAYSYLALNYEEDDRVLPERRTTPLGKAMLEQVSLFSLTLLLSLTIITPSLAATIQEGDRGSHVVALQTFLQEQGYLEASLTGYYGSETKMAVLRYQEAQGLQPDGIVGEETVNSFCRYGKSVSNNSSFQNLAVNSDPTIEQLQKELEIVGYNLNDNPPLVSSTAIVTQTQQEIEITESTLSYTYPVPTLPQAVAQTPQSEILGIGSQGENVRQLQQRLRTLGYYNGEVTGYYGEQTREAVIRFQRDRGLQADGIAGASTFSALLSQRNSTSQPEILTIGTQGEKVRQLQQSLQTLGYYNGEITGYYGEQTQEAVIRFQRDRGLQADGIAGASTFSSLNRPLVQEGIRNLQQRLKAAGFYSGEVDGIWGPRTQQAVEAAQRAYGITASDLRGNN